MKREKLKVETCEGCEKLLKEEHMVHGKRETWYTCNLWKGMPEPKSDFEKQDAPSDYVCTRYHSVTCVSVGGNTLAKKLRDLHAYGYFFLNSHGEKKD